MFVRLCVTRVHANMSVGEVSNLEAELSFEKKCFSSTTAAAVADAAALFYVQ